MAVMAGVESAVQIHIDRGDDLNARDASGMTPLMLSAVRDKPAICKLLLSAGADHALLDRLGKTALDIAIAAGSEATASVLSAVRAPAPIAPLTKDAARLSAGEAEPGARSPIPFDDAFEFATMADGWEAEVAALVIPDDPGIREAARATNAAMANHVPIDTWSDWGYLSAYLPDNASFLPAIDDQEAHARLRSLFLRAVREGSAPDEEVIEVSRDSEGEQDVTKASVYRMVLEDMGCETDERLERREAFDDYTVYVDPDETPEEEDALTDALAHVGALTSTQFDPFYLYQREAQRHRLLRAEEEVEIGQAMEASLESALDSLAAWPDGIAHLLDAAKAAQAGELPMRWMCAGPRQEAPLIQDEGIDADPAAAAPETEDPTSAGKDDAEGDQGSSSKPGASDAEFFVATRRLSAVAIDSDRNSPHWSEVRSLLASMRVSSSFLLELADETPRNSCDAADAFRRDMAIHRRYRDRMAASNLKLVLFQAKKYVRSDLPLGDLVQEGNIGLLRSVDKFDWRRGNRFSTVALWWVRQGITRFIADNSRTIRLPVHVFDEVQRLDRESQLFEKRMGRAPELSEIAAKIGMASSFCQAEHQRCTMWHLLIATTGRFHLKAPTRPFESAFGTRPHPLPHPLRLFRQQPQRRHAEPPQRIMSTPIDQRRVVVHEQPVIELRELQQRSNSIGDVDRQPDQPIQVTRLDGLGVRGLIGPTEFPELRRGGRLLVGSDIDAHGYQLQKLKSRHPSRQRGWQPERSWRTG